MNKSHNRIRSQVSRIKKNPKKAVLISLSILFVVFSLLQVERLVNKGTFFGYQVWNPELSGQSKENKAQSGKVKDISKASLPEGKDNEACKQLTKDKVEKILNKSVEQNGGLTPDTKDPVVSACLYTFNSEDKEALLTVLYRVKDTPESAQKTLDSLKKDPQVKTIKSVGDEAIFNPATNQLTVRKSNQLLTLTFSTDDTKIDRQAKLVELAKTWQP